MYKHYKGDYWLSVLIPAHNCSDTIERLLDSIVIQDTDDVEIIICDDQSTDNFMDKVYPYMENLKIKYCKTKPREIHCPSNTRFDGWKIATGEWITFIDDDDMFEPNVFKKIKELIEETGEQKLIYTSFRDYNPITGQYGLTFDGGTWLHGKFYNRYWLIESNIDFEENLYTNEDLHFNGQVMAELGGQNSELRKFDICTYKWSYNPKSFTRSFDTSKHSLLETCFKDYVHSAVDPWFNCFHKYPDNYQEYYDHMIMMILYMYFYIQAFKYSKGEDGIIKSNINLIIDTINRVCKEFDKTVDDIYKDITNNPDFFAEIRKDAEIGSNKFIERESFYDFLYGNIKISNE